MTNQHQATPDDWAQQEDWANRSAFSDSSCIIELRDRVEALEAGQQPQQDKLDRLIALDRDDSTEAAAQQPLAFTGKVVAPITRDRDETGNYLIIHDTPAPAGSLVERVADAIAAQATSAGIVNDRPARAAIREVAKWLKEEGYNTLQAEALAQEANR
jgi:hypothetical protein